ncbi:hypothetical protein TrRE_jg12421, partial [Triparma retinervis]
MPQFEDDAAGKKLKGLYEFIISIGLSGELLSGFYVDFTRSTFSFVGADGKRHRSRMDVARHLGADEEKLTGKEKDEEEEGEYNPKKRSKSRAPRVPKFTIADAEAKLLSVGVTAPAKMDLTPAAAAMLRKTLAINTNKSGGTGTFKEALEDLEEAHPIFQDEIINAMKIYKANSSGMTKLYFRFLLGNP